MAQGREADAATLKNKSLSETELMERAGTACAEWILREVPAGHAFLILCGRGNNGGDGLVIARQLWKRGKQIRVCIAEAAGKGTPAFNLNLQRWEQECGGACRYIREVADLELPEAPYVVIDAILGSGLTRKPEAALAELIRTLNQISAPVISIDIPSGMPGDGAPGEKDPVIRATNTLCLGTLKPAFVLDRNTAYTGSWQLLDIGLDETFLTGCPTNWYLLEPGDIGPMLPPRPLAAHKGNFGHALLAAGSYGKAGAAILAARACMRSGVGLITVRTPALCVNPVQSAVPEAMVSPDEGPQYLEQGFDCTAYSAVGFGPGLGTGVETGNVLKRVIQDYSGPLVLDADALNLLSLQPTWLSFLNPETLLTPHPGEFARLAGRIEDPVERISAQQQMSQRYGIYILVKGRYSALSCPDGQVIFNSSGNSGMARGGAGDALTGLITGLAAQGLPMFRAALCGMYLHGLAGDIAAENQTDRAMSISDLIEYLPEAFRGFSNG